MSFTAPTIPLDVYGEANIRLGKIEALKNVTIIFAVESGSRAWGFPSPDSDNDVRFFYIHPLKKYLGLREFRDVIETPIDGVWDVNGWDLRKALGLLISGNATVAEWLSSPLIYREHGPLPAKIRTLIHQHATPAHAARHYYGLANTIYKKDIARGVGTANASPLSPEMRERRLVNYKAYLYAVRAACAISWVRKLKSLPPMSMPALLAQDIIGWDEKELLKGLLHKKATMGEFGEGPRIPVLDRFIEEMTNWVKIEALDKTPISEAFVTEANEILLEALGVGR
jgi:predicted nucleotidyltransferase